MHLQIDPLGRSTGRLAGDRVAAQIGRVGVQLLGALCTVRNPNYTQSDRWPSRIFMQRPPLA